MIITVTKKQFHWALASLIAFAVISLLMAINCPFPVTIDTTINNFMAAAHSKLGDDLMMIVTFLGSPKITLLYAAVIAGALAFARLRLAAIWVITTVVGGDLLASLLKHVFHRSRPTAHLAIDNGYSFPSGHAFGTAMIVVILMIVIIPNVNRERNRLLLNWAAVTFGCLILLSRLCLQAHYLSDVAGGALLAYAVVIFSAWQLYPLMAKQLRERVSWFADDIV